MPLRSLVPVVLLALAVLPAAAQPAAADLLARTEAVYRGLDAYRLGATIAIEMEAGGMRQGMELRVETARRGPDALRGELRSDALHLVAVGGADSTLVVLPDAGVFARRAGPLRLDDASTPVPDLAGKYATIGQDVDTAWVDREATLDVDGAARAAWVVEVRYTPRPTAAGADSTHKTLWIDQADFVVLRDDTWSYASDSPFGGPAEMREQTVFTRLALGMPDAALFALAPPPGATEVPADELLGAVVPADAGLVGRTAADFTLPALDGAAVTLSDLRGRTVLINFWATWCGPCRMEMPALDALYAEHADAGLVVLAVDLAEAPADVRAYVERYGYRFPVLLDADGAVGDAYGALSIPVSVIVGPDGVVTHHFEGAQPEATFRAALAELGFE